MKNIFSSWSFESIGDSFSTLWRRFPQSVILLLVIAGIFSYVVNTETEDIIFQRLIFAGIVTFLLSVGVSLYSETREKTSKNIIFHILPLVYGVLFFLSFHPSTNWGAESFTYIILHMVGFAALIFFAPYISSLLDGEKTSIEYTNYFTRTAWAILMAMIVGGSLFILGLIAIYSVLSLFEIREYVSESKLIGNWAVFALTLIAPFYALISLPIRETLDTKKYEINRFFSFLIRYLAIPAIFVYFTILYAYSAKVLLNFSEWPKGVISWMVIGFSSFGYLTYIFSKPYEAGKWVGIFRRYFPYAVIPELLMLAYAIGLRISQYDLTMNRYFVVIFGLWLLGISLYFILSRRKSLAIIVASLSIISLLISLGPWSVFSLPRVRQEARLMHNLVTAGILQGDTIVPLDEFNDISRELSGHIASEIKYLCETDECQTIKTLFAKELEGVKEEYPLAGKPATELNTWTIISTLHQKLKVGYYTEDALVQHQSWYMARENDEYAFFPLQVSGYDEVIKVYSTGSYGGNAISHISVDSDSQKADLLSASGTIIDTFPLDTVHRALDGKGNQLSGEEMTFDIVGGVYDVRFIFSSYAIRTRSSTENPLSISGYALLRKQK